MKYKKFRKTFKVRSREDVLVRLNIPSEQKRETFRTAEDLIQNKNYDKYKIIETTMNCAGGKTAGRSIEFTLEPPEKTEEAENHSEEDS